MTRLDGANVLRECLVTLMRLNGESRDSGDSCAVH